MSIVNFTVRMTEMKAIFQDIVHSPSIVLPSTRNILETFGNKRNILQKLYESSAEVETSAHGHNRWDALFPTTQTIVVSVEVNFISNLYQSQSQVSAVSCCPISKEIIVHQ